MLFNSLKFKQIAFEQCPPLLAIPMIWNHLEMSGGIWSVNETGFTGFEVDQCKDSFGHNSVDLQQIAIKFGQVNLLVKNIHIQIWLLR